MKSEEIIEKIKEATDKWEDRSEEENLLVWESLFGDQAADIAVGCCDLESNFCCRLVNQVVDLSDLHPGSGLLVGSPDVLVNIQEVCVIKDRQWRLDTGDTQQVITNLGWGTQVVKNRDRSLVRRNDNR